MHLQDSGGDRQLSKESDHSSRYFHAVVDRVLITVVAEAEGRRLAVCQPAACLGGLFFARCSSCVGNRIFFNSLSLDLDEEWGGVELLCEEPKSASRNEKRQNGTALAHKMIA